MASLEDVRQVVMALDYRLRNTVGRSLVERHAPELLDWLNRMLGLKPAAPKAILPEIQIVETGLIQIDPELSRVAYVLDLFPSYRVWLYALRRLGNGAGWIQKADFNAGLKRLGIEIHERSLDRYIQQGHGIFWTYDRKTQRIYLRSSEKVAASLSRLLLESRFADSLESNRPGVRRVLVDLSGSIRQAAAHVYAAWFSLKQKGKASGIRISRETLMRLWGVSTPTLLEWEKLAGIDKTPNFAQQADTSIENVPAHARLLRGKDGKLFVGWQLPNSYYAPENLQLHARMGNARAVREAVLNVLTDQQPAENRGWGSPWADPQQYQGGSLRLGRLYFEDREERKQGWLRKVDAFSQIQRHLKQHQDIYRPHYALLGRKGRVAIFERYDIATDLPLTRLWQRDMKANRDAGFLLRCHAYETALSKGF